MAPLKWIILFLIFLFTYMFVNFMNYYLFMPKIVDLKNFDKNSNKNLNKKFLMKW
ncbi:ATP synthase F0 subunit 8 (mitochondrion) [Culicoides brevitarsis]|uniref:ATP synthase F0 subunit 8 n=1 Tax=Culicoides brevitarsis TaxID=469753 RepID=UPI002E7627CA|nr:ATP synthase F0 subunit 8 [Culicoides brevitarsis]WPN85960.1 ATP synthase F0 subunit 8 [Culicoides brevitarsis]